MNQQCILGKIGFKSEVLSFFRPFLTSSSELAAFEYMDNGVPTAVEYLSVDGSLVPSTSGLWTSGAENRFQVRDLYLFSSALEAISFFHFYKEKLRFPGQVGIVSLGLLPSFSQFHALRKVYANAKFHFVFAADLLGRVLDCRASLWTKQKSAGFLLARNSELVSVAWRGREFLVDTSKLSLHAFEKLLKLRSGVRTHKPPKPFNSFYELFLSSI